jgi:hypothetical protein
MRIREGEMMSTTTQADSHESAQTEETKPKWTMERIHREVQEARTKIFVIAKVLETGNLKFAENPEWGVVIKPLIRDLVLHAGTIDQLIGSEESLAEK